MSGTIITDKTKLLISIKLVMQLSLVLKLIRQVDLYITLENFVLSEIKMEQ